MTKSPTFPRGPEATMLKKEDSNQTPGNSAITRREALKRAGKIAYVAPAVLIITNKSLEARCPGSVPPPPPE